MKFRNSKILYTQNNSIFRILNVCIHEIEFIKCIDLLNPYNKYIWLLIYMFSFHKGEYLVHSIRLSNVFKALYMIYMRN